jgi:hypothetical protein
MRTVVVIAVAAISTSIISIIMSIGVIESLKVTGIALGVLTIIVIIARICSYVKSRLKRAPAIIQAIVSVMLNTIALAILTIVTILAYEDWKSGKDMTGMWCALAGYSVGYVVSERDRILMANKSASADGGASAPSRR